MNPALDAVNTIGSGALSTSTGVANGPAGSMVYVGLGVTFLVAVAGVVMGFIHMVKG